MQTSRTQKSRDMQLETTIRRKNLRQRKKLGLFGKRHLKKPDGAASTSASKS